MAMQKHISNVLGLRKSTVGILFMTILVGMGERTAERFLPIYLIALGGGALSIGFLNGLDNLLSALYAFPGGYLSDRFGTKKALLFLPSRPCSARIISCGILLYLLRLSVARFPGRSVRPQMLSRHFCLVREGPLSSRCTGTIFQELNAAAYDHKPIARLTLHQTIRRV